MTDQVVKFLDAVQNRADMAPRGPWVWTASLAPAAHQLVTNGAALDIATCKENPDCPSTIAEFIAHARTDVPMLVGMVRAVLDLHQPVDLAAGRVRILAPEPRMSCRTCGALWPCPTYRAVTDALPGAVPASGSDSLEGKA